LSRKRHRGTIGFPLGSIRLRRMRQVRSP